MVAWRRRLYNCLRRFTGAGPHRRRAAAKLFRPRPPKRAAQAKAGKRILSIRSISTIQQGLRIDMSTEPDKYGRFSPRKVSRSTRLLVAVYIVIGALLIAVGGYFLAHRAPAQPQGGGRFGRGGAGGPNAPPMPVNVADVATGDIRITLNALGTVTPLRNVTVGAQVAGQLQRVNFKEGQMVKEGDLLAEIDPRTYQAAVDQAEGVLARDQALLENAKTDLARYETLFKEDSIAKQQLDSQRSLVHQYEGTIKADQGSIGTAKVNLAYTKIVAPVSGRVGLRQVDPGNNVQNGTSIVVITQLAPIDVLFTLPEDNLPAVLKKMHAGSSLDVDIYDRSGQTKLASGALASLDNQIDTSTGTVKAKAEFANADQNLFPNQFVNARVLLDTLHGVTVIPTSSLQQGANGLFVYVVQDDDAAADHTVKERAGQDHSAQDRSNQDHSNQDHPVKDHTVAVRTIKTGTTEGDRVQVTEGLNVGEKIVTEGADRLREGSKVLLPGETPPENAGAERGQRGQRRGDGAEGQRRGGGDGADGQHRRRGEQGESSGDKNSGAQPAQGPASTTAKPADDPGNKDAKQKREPKTNKDGSQ
jgi:multidrug efflux system membrane fusion protein